MWDTYRLSTWGNFSLRKIALFFAAVVMSALFMAIAHSTPTFADGATWDGDNIKYGGDTYTPVQNAPVIPGILDSNKNIYQFKAADGTVKIIAIESTDKTKEITNAQMGTFTLDTSGNYYTLPGASPPSYVTVAASTTGSSNTSSTNCAIQSIGWIVCPVTKGLAWIMDKIFDLLKGFFEVKTIVSDTNSSIYQMWDIMRGFANLCFIVAFLIIIYSQITSMGINNYEIKKMIPKLIVAAVLVNVSYIICGIAVDASNILGNSLQQMFMDMQHDLVGASTTVNTDASSWSSWTSFILSGGTVATAGLVTGGIALASGAGVLSLVAILGPFLLGVLISAVVALLVLAVRQALIVVLVAIAPLAFVAYLLPGTEKWFDRWKDVMLTMLIMFPMFAVVFGGAQLAGAVIIKSASSINMILVGMFVQVAPLIVTPLLIKLGGSILGRIAGVVNNKQKGFLDSTRNRLQEADKRQRTRRIAEGQMGLAQGKGRFTSAKRWAASRQDVKHRKEQDNEAYEAYSKAHASAHWKERLLEDDNNGSQNILTPSGRRRKQLSSVRNAYASTYGAQMQSEALDAVDKREKEEAKADSSAFYNAYGSHKDHHGHTMTVSQAAQRAALENAVETQAAQAATRQTNLDVAAQLSASKALRTRAAGIDTTFGEVRALAQADQTRADDRSQGMKHIELMINMQNPSNDDVMKLAKGVSAKGIEINREVIETATKMIAKGGNVKAINELGEWIDLSPTSDEFIRTAFIDELKTNSSKPKHYSATLLDELGQGKVFGKAGVADAMMSALQSNKYDAKGLVTEDKDTLDRLAATMRLDSRAQTPQVREMLKKTFDDLVADPQLKGSMANRRESIIAIGRLAGIDRSVIDRI